MRTDDPALENGYETIYAHDKTRPPRLSVRALVRHVGGD